MEGLVIVFLTVVVFHCRPRAAGMPLAFRSAAIEFIDSPFRRRLAISRITFASLGTIVNEPGVFR
jgi:hypothetical protein